MPVAIYFLCFVLFLIGLYAVAAKKNLIKIVIGLVIIKFAINLFIVAIGYLEGGASPVTGSAALGGTIVDPLPQALALSAIIIGLGMIILMVSICIRIFEKHGTFNIAEIRRLKG